MRKPSVRNVVLVMAVVLVASACDWPQNLYGPEHTGSSPDRSIDAAAIVAGEVAPRWTAPLGFIVTVVVAGGRVYGSGPDGSIVGYDAPGNAGCSGTPKTCSPRWSGRPGDGATLGDPLVANGLVIASEVSGRTYAFDARGTTNCAGAPPVCAPKWTAESLGGGLNGTAANGVLYRTYGSSTPTTGLAAYDIAGVQQCSGSPTATCEPMWTASLPGTFTGTPAVAEGIAYVVTSMGLYAFDAGGTTNCGGLPKTCTPLWTGKVPGTPAFGDVTVANGLTFVGALEQRQVVGFDAAGIRSCSGTPKTCRPVWFAKKAGPDVSVANGKLYTRSPGGLSVFDATGAESCSGTGVCQRLWRYPDNECGFHPFPCYQYGPPVVANGVIYRSASGSIVAYDATGTLNCSGTPKVCRGLRSWEGGNIFRSPVIANRFVYIGTVGSLVATGLP